MVYMVVKHYKRMLTSIHMCECVCVCMCVCMCACMHGVCMSRYICICLCMCVTPDYRVDFKAGYYTNTLQHQYNMDAGVQGSQLQYQ